MVYSVLYILHRCSKPVLFQDRENENDNIIGLFTFLVINRGRSSISEFLVYGMYSKIIKFFYVHVVAIIFLFGDKYSSTGDSSFKIGSSDISAVNWPLRKLSYVSLGLGDG